MNDSTIAGSGRWNRKQFPESIVSKIQNFDIDFFVLIPRVAVQLFLIPNKVYSSAFCSAKL